MSEQLLQSALDLARRGFRVFPLEVGGYTPAVKGWQQLATRDEDQIRKVWSARAFNIGVATGDGLLVTDVDNKNGKNGTAALKAYGLPPEAFDTFTVQTPTGGFHVYFSGPDVTNSVGRLGDGLDVRSAGGYVVGPGSVLLDGAKDGQAGGAYIVVRDTRIRDCPDAIRARLEVPIERTVTTPAVDLDRPDAVARGVAYLGSEAPLATEGDHGDLTTFKVAATLKDYGLTEAMAVDLMAEHWNDRCSPPWDYDDLRTKVANAYDYGARQPGLFHPAAEFAGVNIAPPPNARKPSSWFRHGDGWDLNANWLYYEMLPAVGVAVLLAPSQAGKTFLALELARSLATGKPFFKETPDEKGGTLFVFAGTEGSGLARRMEALGEKEALPISATICGNLAEHGALTQLLADLQAEAAYVLETFGVPVRLIVLETMAASGLLADENDNAEASRAMSNLAQIGQAMNALVMTSHHPAKGKDEARGASAIPSSADYVLAIRRKGKETVRELELEKARDAEQRKLGTFSLVPVDLGVDARGRKITSLTVSQGERMSNAVRAAPHSEVLVQCLEWALAEEGEVIRGKKYVEISEVRAVFKDRSPGSADRSNIAKRFNVALSYCEDMGSIEVIPFNDSKYLTLREISV